MVIKSFALALALAAVFAAGSPAALADTAPATDPVKINFTPYVWLPTINGSFRYNYSDISGGRIENDLNQTFDTGIGPNSYLSNINFALMGTVTVQKGKLGVLADFINANVSASTAKVANFTGPEGHLNTTLGAQAQTQVVSTVLTIAPTYTVYHANNSSVNVLAGGQFLWLSTNANVQVMGQASVNDLTATRTYSAGASRKANYSDVIFGSYGEFGIGKHVSIPYYVDLGTGTPSFTWEGLLGVKYGNALLGWRYLQFNAGSSTDLIQRLSLGGPMVGYTIHF